MKSADIRQAFLDFFRKHGHAVVPSSPLVPANDPTLLFTNAGMVQFKETFLGLEERPYTRAVSSQRCVRAGGKHNDLENVGYTARHHTFFEMLGNFSFGDYFKNEAIHYAWQLLTEVFKLPPERLWVTVFDEDDEAADIWLNQVKIDPTRFSRIGARDNFWSMGDTGPCGPCTEIFYDHGPGVWGGPPGSPEEDGDRYVEIWNLVFMQYDRGADGALKPLPKPSVDTGMGLERLAAVLQGVHSNYDIDLFRNLIQAVMTVTGTTDAGNDSLKVIADHIRSCAFLITDGVLPSNEGRGYVLRRIIRRAIRHGYKLGVQEPFFHKLVSALVLEMGDAYPELARAGEQVERVLRVEEERFAETLDQGMRILDQDIAAMNGDAISGATVFKLYDTYGFPADLTADIARERGLTVDMLGFEREMDAQRERARAASRFGGAYTDRLDVDVCSEFTGYDHLNDAAKVVALFAGSEAVDVLKEGRQGTIILDRTPFYAESGGQVGDRGVVSSGSALFEVEDTQKQGHGVHGLIGRLQQGSLKVGDQVEARVDRDKRQATMLNHSATHLLHAALQHILGEHVAQKGSLVDDGRLRFDFSHFEPISGDQLKQIEALVNEKIRENADVLTRVMSYHDAIDAGAVALFGEKYGDEVRVLSIGDFSVELCGGTHAQRAGDIGLFKIVAESGIAAGVRRIEAVTGAAALKWVSDAEDQLSHIAELLKGSRDGVADKVRQLMEKSRQLEKELERMKARMASSQGTELTSRAIDVDGVKVLSARLDTADAKTLRDTADQLKNKLGSAVIVLAAVDGDRVMLVAGVTRDMTRHFKAGELVNHVARQVGGKGGGRPDMAQAGGNDPAALDRALASVVEWVKQQQ